MHDKDLFRIVGTRSWLPCGVIWWEVAACHAVLGSFRSVNRGVHNIVGKSWTLEGNRTQQQQILVKEIIFTMTYFKMKCTLFRSLSTLLRPEIE